MPQLHFILNLQDHTCRKLSFNSYNSCSIFGNTFGQRAKEKCLSSFRTRDRKCLFSSSSSSRCEWIYTKMNRAIFSRKFQQKKNCVYNQKWRNEDEKDSSHSSLLKMYFNLNSKEEAEKELKREEKKLK